MKTLMDLGGPKKKGKRGNKTQGIIFVLLERLPGKKYYCFINNLFVSERFLEFFWSQRYNITRTCWTNTRVISELIDLKQKDRGDKLL
jgi:hypothetical protein